MIPRAATKDDMAQLVALHAQAWCETYPGLLPEAEIERMTAPDRLTALWAFIQGQAEARVAILPGAGFAAMGPQRDAALRVGYPEELWAIYLLRSAQGAGHGRALLASVAGRAAFSVLVLEGNVGAIRFYERAGGQFLDRRADLIGQSEIVELQYGWKGGGFRAGRGGPEAGT